MEKPPVVWITGASSGIGYALAREYLRNGLDVFITSRNFEKLGSVKSEFADLKGKCNIYQSDVRNSKQVEEAFSFISRDYFVECLINNAGISRFKKFEDHSFEEAGDIISTNLLGAFYTSKTVLKDMKKMQRGQIVNIISVTAVKVFKNSSVYAASKAGLEAFSDVLREEVRKYGIKVMNIYPGATKTGIWPESALEKYSDNMIEPDELAEYLFKVIREQKNICTENIVIRPITGDL